MNLSLAFFLSSYFVVFLGFLALFYTGELSASYLLMSGLSIAGGAAVDWRGGKGLFPSILANLAMVAIFVLTLFSIFVLKSLPIQELVHFLLALQSVKLLALKKRRDWLQLYLLAFFSVVSASALTVDLSFAGVFIAYLFAAPWALILLNLKESVEAAGQEPRSETRLLDRSLLGLAGATGGALLVLTLFFFTLFPRFAISLFANSWATGPAVTGFSDLLALGQVAAIQKNGAVAMRVRLEPPGEANKLLYWRGIALDLFDGQKWRKSKGDGVWLRRVGDRYQLGDPMEPSGPHIRQNIILEPSGSSALFVLETPVALFGRLGNLQRDSLGNLRAAYPFPFPISYDVLSQTTAARTEAVPGGSFLQLPDVNPRISELAERATEGIQDPLQKARSLERFLRGKYRYALDGLPIDVEDPLSTFLFDTQQGNCEYFASALAVMLRIVGIPARVVNGYLGGEWNPYGEYFLVRQSDAHSWVEAHVPGAGWTTFDPTPPAPIRSRKRPLGPVTQLFDYLQMRWYRYIVNFTVADQQELITALGRPRRWIDFNLREISWDGFGAWKQAARFPWTMVGALLAAVALVWNLSTLIRNRTPLARRPSQAATERYRRFFCLLNKQGIAQGIAGTPDEFSRRVGEKQRHLAAELTSLYQQARFSSTRPPEILTRMDQILADLKKSRA
jgi:transglutaminase-like putative cysteine protease